MKRISGIIAAVVLVGVVTLLILADGNIGTGSSNELGQFAAPSNVDPATVRHLGEIGPGACWPGDTRPGGGHDAGFASINGPKEAAAWLRANPEAAKRYTSWLTAHKDYYLIYEVVPEWDSLDEVERSATYVERTRAVKMLTSIRVQNTFCKDKDGNVSLWEIQVLPIQEWIFFIPGHEPGTEDPRPAFKAVCGNPLLPPVEVTPPAPQAPPVTSKVPPPCQGSACNPPPPCKKPCNPPCTTCTNSPKKPNEAPGQGGAGDGGASKYGGTGNDRQVATGPAAPPKAGNPPPVYVPPPPPANNNPPAGSTPTSNQPPPPPPPSGANPPGGGGNTGTVPPPP